MNLELKKIELCLAYNSNPVSYMNRFVSGHKQMAHWGIKSKNRQFGFVGWTYKVENFQHSSNERNNDNILVI